MIFCPECGTPNPDKAKFCKNCGKNLAASLEEQKGQRPENIQKKPQAVVFETEPINRPYSYSRKKEKKRRKAEYPEDFAYLPSYGKKRGKSSKGLIIAALIELICLGLIIGVFCLIGDKKSNPEQVAKKYFKAFVEKDWDTAYDMTDIPEGKFLGRRTYVSVMENTYDMDIDSYKIKVKKRGPDDEAEVSVDYIEEDGGRENLKFTLLKQDKKTMLFFPSWKVSSEDQIYKDYKIYNVPKGTKLAYDGIALTEEDMGSVRDREALKAESIEENSCVEPGEESCVDLYSADVFKGIHEVQTVVPWCQKDVRYCCIGEDCRQEEFFEEEPFDIVLTEKGEHTIKIKMQKGLEKIVTAAVNGRDFSEVEDLFAKDYISQCKEDYKEVYDALFYDRYYKLDEITFSDFNYHTDYDDDSHKFYSEMRFEYNERWTYYGSERSSYGDAVMKAHFVFENGDYKISGFEI